MPGSSPWADKSPDNALALPLMGLFSEAGSLLNVVKKKQRHRAAYVDCASHVGEELGDVLWYFAVVASRGGVFDTVPIEKEVGLFGNKTPLVVGRLRSGDIK